MCATGRDWCSFAPHHGMGRQRNQAAAACHLCLQPCSSCTSQSQHQCSLSGRSPRPCPRRCTVGTRCGHIRKYQRCTCNNYLFITHHRNDPSTERRDPAQRKRTLNTRQTTCRQPVRAQSLTLAQANPQAAGATGNLKQQAKTKTDARTSSTGCHTSCATASG